MRSDSLRGLERRDKARLTKIKRDECNGCSVFKDCDYSKLNGVGMECYVPTKGES